MPPSSKHLLSVYIFCTGLRQLVILVALIVYLRRRSELSVMGEFDEDTLDAVSKVDSSYQVLVLLGAHYRDLHCAAVVCAAIYAYVCVFFYFGPMLHDWLKHQRALSDAYSSTTYDYLRRPQLYQAAIVEWRRVFKERLLASGEFFFTKFNQRLGRQQTPEEEQKLRQTIAASQFEPKNRNSQWHRKLNNIWLLLHCCLLIYDYVAAFGCSWVSREINFRFKKKTKFSRRDQWSMLEECVFLFFGTYLFSNPLVKLMLNEIDMNRVLGDLNQRMSQLVTRMKNSKEFYCCISDKMAAKYLNNTQVSCNKEALEVYMYFRYFTKEQATHRQFANQIVSQYISYLACVVFTMLLVIKSLDGDDFYIVVSAVALMCTFINCVFLLCASTNCKCIRAIQIAWQLLANSQQTELGARIEKQLKLGRVTSMPSIGMQHLIEKRPKQTADCLCEVQDSLVAHLIDAHTRFLWYRLVSDQSQVSEIFSYTTLGFYQMDYKSMIQFNFWLTSIVMATYMRDWI